MKKFTWIFGLALLWGGLNAVAQTVKEVGDFDKLKEAVDNIPTFAKVKECSDAYEAAKNAFTTATSAVAEAESDLEEYTAKIEDAQADLDDYIEKNITPLQQDLANAKQALANAKAEQKRIEDEGKTTITDFVRSASEKTYSEYVDFYNAITSKTYNNEKKLYYGVIKEVEEDLFGATTTYIAVFATESIYEDLKESNKNIIWDDKASGEYKGYFIPSDWAKTGGVYGSQTKIPFKYDGNTQKISRVRFYFIDPQTGKPEFQSRDADNELQNNDYTVQVESSTNFIAVAFNEAYPKIKRYIYTKNTIENPAYTEAKKAVENAQSSVDRATNALILAKNDDALKTLEDAVSDAKNDARVWQDALATAKRNLIIAERNVATAKANYNKEAAPIAKKGNVEEGSTITPDEEGKLLDKDGQPIDEDGYLIDEDGLRKCEKMYTTITLTANISVSGVTGEHIWEKWPAGYTLNGDGNSVTSDIPLFDVNEGTIRNIANVQTSIATVNKGEVIKCLTRRDANTYRVYRSSNDYTDYTSVEDAIYTTQESVLPFSYDMEKKEVLPYSEEYRLYQAQYANDANKNTYTFKLNIRSNQELKYDEAKFNKQFIAGYTDENAILYIDDEVATTKVAGMKNVAVMENGAYTCHNTVLEEGTGVKGFYIPKDFLSEKLSYTRNFKQKVSAVCLPFELNNDTKTLLKYENTFQFSNVDTSTGVMWFTTKTTIDANQPCLISFPETSDERTIFAEITSSLLFKATPNELVAVTANGSKEFYGTYRTATTADLIGNEGNAVYGIQDGWLKKAGETARLQQFRSYVRRPETVADNEAPSYKIGLMDEDGNELSTAIETVSGEIISGFKAKGGDNAIEVSTDEACPVKVYTLSGALVKSTRVEAGTTSLPVKAGIYVVNGVKVIVK